jgi:hypothetical protein
MTTTYQTASTITYNPHNTRFRTPLEPEANDVIRFTKLRPLGRGGQGDVHKVVDMYNGNHHACKIIAVKAEVPDLNIYSEKDFRAKVEMEVNLVRQLEHVSSFCLSAFCFRFPHNCIRTISYHTYTARDSRVRTSSFSCLSSMAAFTT